MTTPSPELRNLYLRVIRRVHPDGAIDEQDRLRCELLTQEANHAYALGDEAGLRAVLEPKGPRSGWNLRGRPRRQFVLWWKALKVKPWQMAGAAIAFLLALGYIIIAVTPPKTAHAVRPQAEAPQLQDHTRAPMTNIPASEIPAGKPSRQSASAYGNRNGEGRTPSQDPPDLKRYLETVKSKVENKFNQRSLGAPDGTSADIAVVLRGNGEPEKPHLMMPSGYPSVDSACLQSVEEIRSFGATPTDQNMTVNFQCTVRAR
jgi:hypothetical protein